jgi:hypothetical protein
VLVKLMRFTVPGNIGEALFNIYELQALNIVPG